MRDHWNETRAAAGNVVGDVERGQVRDTLEGVASVLDKSKRRKLTREAAIREYFLKRGTPVTKEEFMVHRTFLNVLTQEAKERLAREAAERLGAELADGASAPVEEVEA